jgi:hypothetical protein
MKDFFATCGRPDKFKWEKDDTVNGPKYHEASDRGAEVEDHINLDQSHNPDPFVDNDITGETVVSLASYFRPLADQVALCRCKLARSSRIPQ